MSISEEEIKTYISENNEKAFLQRYGISLRNIQAAYLADGKKPDEDRVDLEKMLVVSGQRGRGAEVDVSEYLILLIIGTGDGSFLSVVRDAISPLTKVIVVEPDPDVIFCACSRYDLSALFFDERFIWIVPSEDWRLKLESTLRGMVGIENLHHIGSLIIPGCEDHYAEVYNETAAILQKLGDETGQVEGFYRNLGKMAFENELYALSVLGDNSTAAQLFEHIPTRDIPVILVAAGPSLQQNADRLKAAEGKALIISVAHASKALAKHSITPDLVAAIDPQNEYAESFFAHDPQRNYYLLLSAQTASEIQRMYLNRCIYYGFQNEFIHVKALENQPVGYRSGGSVATEIFSLLRTAGFTRFILVGQDLAYNDRGDSHASGEKATKQHSRDIPSGVMGINGQMLDTRAEWLDFLHFFENEIRSHPEIQVIDATEGGAMIKGTMIMPLSEAISLWCDTDHPIRDWLSRLPRAQSPEEQKKLNAEMMELADMLGSMCEHLDEALTLNSRIAPVFENIQSTLTVTQADLNRYDELYQMILSGRVSDLLTGYCQDLMQDYINNAAVYEQNGDVVAKLRAEATMMEGLRGRIGPLRQYMMELFGTAG